MITLLLSFIFTVPSLEILQDKRSAELSFEVNRIYPYLSINKEDLSEIQSINEFKNEANGQNLSYSPLWVNRFITVEVSARQNGELRKARSKDDKLIQAQKDIIKTADPGTNIKINVQYIPQNTLEYNEPKELNFEVAIEPEEQAQFPGGQKQLNKYLKSKAIDLIPNSAFKGFDLTAIKFIVDQEGRIMNAHLFESEYPSGKKDKIDKLLLKTISDMPCWVPAQYADGTRVKQEFVFTVGNLENCLVHLFNIQ